MNLILSSPKQNPRKRNDTGRRKPPHYRRIKMKIRVHTKMLGADFVREFTDMDEALEWMQVLCTNRVWFDVDHIEA